MKAIGLALCNHNGHGKNYLFRMPAYERLENGDRVVVETKHGEAEALVVGTATIYGEESDEYQMIVKAAGADLPLKKVLRKISYKELAYDEEDDAARQEG